MSDLTVAGFFTRNNGAPATGLTLAQIDCYLTAQDRATGADTVVWTGAEHPTEEIDNIGAYIRIYTLADLDTYNYFARYTYTGVVVLDCLHVMGAISIDDIPCGSAIEFTYTVTDAISGLPIEGVRVAVTTDAAGTNVVWCGYTDTFGVARDAAGRLPRLDPGTYYFCRSKAGYIFGPPACDPEVVS